MLGCKERKWCRIQCKKKKRIKGKRCVKNDQIRATFECFHLCLWTRAVVIQVAALQIYKLYMKSKLSLDINLCLYLQLLLYTSHWSNILRTLIKYEWSAQKEAFSKYIGSANHLCWIFSWNLVRNYDNDIIVGLVQIVANILSNFMNILSLISVPMLMAWLPYVVLIIDSFLSFCDSI